VLGRAEIERLLAACSPRDRLTIATVLYSGLRISEMSGLIWDDIDFAAGVIHVRSQLSRAHRGRAGAAGRAEERCLRARRAACSPACATACRPQGGRRMRRSQRLGVRDRPRHTARTPQRRAPRPWSRRHVDGAQCRWLAAAALPRPSSHVASHLIIDLGLDVAQVSRILGHARVTITLDVYTHLLDDARHTRDIRTRMAETGFAELLDALTGETATVVALPLPPGARRTTKPRPHNSKES
jgi:integrase